MPARLKTNPRKFPQQDRSRETVDALLEATSQILVKDGYDHASTNKIALKAGVSIGSLYQYFPNKESLVAELIERHHNEMADICRVAMAKFADAELAVLIRETVKAMVAIHVVNPRLHIVLQEQVPRVGKLKKLDELHAITRDMVRAQLIKRPHEVRVADPELAAFMVVEIVDKLLHASLAPDARQDWTMDILIDEMTDLLYGYLARRPD